MDTEQQNNQQRGNEGNNDPASSSFDQRALTFGAGEDTASAQSTLETVGGATEQTSAFISHSLSQSAQLPSSSTMNDDVYEFKSSPEDNVGSMLLNSEVVRAAANAAFGSDSRYGLDDEADLMEDEGNLTIDEQMETDEFDDKRRRQPNLPTFEIERCEDDEDYEDMDEEQRRAEERRKVPPLRIIFNKNNGEESSKNVSPSADGPSSSTGTPNRKRPMRKAPNAGTSSEKRPNSGSIRMTRGQLAKQAVTTNDGTGMLTGKRARATRRNVTSSNAVASRALTPKREREVSQAPSTSSAIQNDQAGTSMPPSPDGNSRSSNGATSENDPAFNLQPERLSFSVTNLFNQSDLGAYGGLKKMLHKKWARDFHDHQEQTTIPAQYKSVIPKAKSKPAKLYIPEPPQPKTDCSSIELMENQLTRQEHLRKKHARERRQLVEFIEREFKRQLNNIPAKSRTTGITAMRILSDNDVYNGNVLDINVDDLNKIQSKSRDEVITQVKKQMEIVANNTLKRHTMEADCLYFEQCLQWERFVTDQMPMDKRAKIEDFTLRNCMKRIKTKTVNLARIIR